MKKIILIQLFLTSLASFANPFDDPCSYGIATENSGIAVNVATGGTFDYSAAADFIVPFGKIFTLNQAKLNILKGESDLSFVNVKFWSEAGGFPSQVIASFNNLVPTSQQFVYNIEPGLSSYEITLDLPSSITLQRGKYFIQIAAMPGGEGGAWWEVTEGLNQSLGVFDYVSFDQGITWEGSGYGDYVFTVTGSCADSGEILPDYGIPCTQGDLTNVHENGIDMVMQKVADDFIVPENTIFHLNHLDLTVLSMGPGINNATINIRNSVDEAPGNVIHSIVNVGPTHEHFYNYWPWTGFPPEIPVLKWDFDFTPIALTTGRYFIEVVPNIYATDALLWEGTSLGTNGDYSYSSFDGISWVMNEGYNQVFSVGGFCETTLGTETHTGIAGLSFYPNPVEDVLNLASVEQIKDITVYNLIGKKMAYYNAPNNTINMKALSSGMYLLKIQQTNGQFETIKVVKK